MGLAVRSARSNDKKGTIRFLVSTMFCALLFLTIKGLEWKMHFAEGYYPGKFFHPVPGAEVQDPLAHIFFGLYYVMTGMHGLHVVVGFGLMTWLLIRTMRNEFNSENYVALENTSLFWHLVDIVWIFLYPLLYLAR